jgi:prolipoprotein diacylglyceryl transferase
VLFGSLPVAGGDLLRLVAYLPSPSSGQIHLGPLRITAYGFMIALGVLAAVELARRRAPSRGADPDDISSIAIWAVPAGLVGARAYHVITDWWRFRDHWLDVFKVWEGGLGIPGGLVAGVGVGLWVAHRRGLRLSDALDLVAPALPLAQGIGRWGNWWNQELFGRPSTLPWALEIDPAHRPPGYEAIGTYHPTFLYESLWDLGLCVALVLIDRRHRLRRGQLFCLYVAGYGLGRLWVESLRIDEASHIGPFRVNIWMSLLAIVAGVVGFLIQGRRAPAGPTPASGATGSGDRGGEADGDTDGPHDRAGEGSEAAGSAGGASAGGEVGEDGVAESGPGLLGPGTERGVGERDAGEPGDRVHPAEGAGPPEVAERPG